MDDRLRWKPLGSDVEAGSGSGGATPVVRPRPKGPAAAAGGGSMGSKVRLEVRQGGVTSHPQLMQTRQQG